MEPLFHFDRLGGADQPGQPRGGGGDCYKGLGGGFTTKLSHRDRNVQHFSARLLIRFAWALKAGGVGGLPELLDGRRLAPLFESLGCGSLNDSRQSEVLR